MTEATRMHDLLFNINLRRKHNNWEGKAYVSLETKRDLNN